MSVLGLRRARAVKGFSFVSFRTLTCSFSFSLSTWSACFMSSWNFSLFFLACSGFAADAVDGADTGTVAFVEGALDTFVEGIFDTFDG